MSLRAYLAQLAATLLTPAERQARLEKARTVLKEWNGFDPSDTERAALDAELNRRIQQAQAPAR